MRSIVNISMPKQMAEMVEEEVLVGKYASKSEFIRMLLKQWSKRRTKQLNKKTSTGIRVRNSKSL